jgi:hypothetical protein
MYNFDIVIFQPLNTAKVFAKCSHIVVKFFMLLSQDQRSDIMLLIVQHCHNATVGIISCVLYL